ncbi:MAG: hypothetical protein KF812_07515 [Fimbriimonadaceae bacterium]|nr:hypothetical protein [Fimbriimonadaceae bacterium]
MQYLDTGWFGIFVTVTIVVFVLFNIARAGKSKGEIFIRRIPGLNALDDAIGRATEMGRPVLMVPGIGSLDAVSVQAVTIFANVTKQAAQFGTPIRLCCADAAVYTLAQEVIRDVYQSQGMIERMDQNSVQFVSDRQFAFAAGVQGIILREQVAATFLLGAFYAESLIFAESANSIGAIQIAGSTQNTQTPFFIAACDYVLIGDEFYAASAYITRQPVLVGSLVGQDWGKMLIISFVVLGTILNSYEFKQPKTTQRVDTTAEVRGGNENVSSIEPYDGDPRTKTPDDTFVYRMFNPIVSPEMLTIEREKEQVEESVEPTEEEVTE